VRNVRHIASKPKNEVCEEAIRVFESSDSLMGLAATCGILSKILGPKADFLDFDEWAQECKFEIKRIGKNS